MGICHSYKFFLETLFIWIVIWPCWSDNIYLTILIFIIFCSTLVVKQKLPGVYIQPSYGSALSKYSYNRIKIVLVELFLLCFSLVLNNIVVPFPPTVWFGVIFIRHGLYQDGVFKFTIYIPDNYPDGDCPVSDVQT